MRALANKIKTLVGNMKGHLKGELGKMSRLGNTGRGASPLDVPDRGPTGHMKEDPFQYGFVHYPAHVGQVDEGHYMIFLILENIKTEIGRKSARVGTWEKGGAGQSEIMESQQTGSQAKKFNTRMGAVKEGGLSDALIKRGQMSGFEASTSHSGYTVSKAIFLYTPPGIKTDQAVEYSNVEMGVMGGFLKGLKATFGGEGSFLDKLKDMDMASFKGLGAAMLDGALSAVGGEGLVAAKQKQSGKAKNPALELAFQSVPFRTFEYEYTFAPKNKKELDNVHKIIQLFRFHMLPELAAGQDTSEFQFNLPSQFEIRYMYKDKENVYIPKISRCALQTCNINYTPHEAFTTFKGDDKGASPNIITMALQFTEMEVMTKNTVKVGY